MVRVFEFGGYEAALSGTGCVRAIMRSIPEAGTTAVVDVRPLTVRGCRPMRNRRGCSVSMVADRDGRVRDVAVVGRGACARDLYESLRREGVACYRVW